MVECIGINGSEADYSNRERILGRNIYRFFYHLISQSPQCIYLLQDSNINGLNCELLCASSISFTIHISLGISYVITCLCKLYLDIVAIPYFGLTSGLITMLRLA